MLEERDSLIKRLTETLLQADTTSRWCMCGDSIESHTAFSSHSPVDSLQYYTNNLLEEVDNLLGTSYLEEGIYFDSK